MRSSPRILASVSLLLVLFGSPGVTRGQGPKKNESSAEVLFPPIKIAPGTRLRKDVLKQHHVWFDRNLVTPFLARAKGQPWEQIATDFVAQTIDDLYDAYLIGEGRYDDATRGCERVAAAHCDDPLVLFLAGRIQARRSTSKERVREDLQKLLTRLSADKTTNPAFLSLVGKKVLSLKYEKAVEEKVLQWLQAALSDGSYGPEDGAVFLHQQYESEWHRYSEDGLRALQPLLAMSPFPEWVKLTMQGEEEYRIGWKYRGGGWAKDVGEEGFKGLMEHHRKAREAFVAAWKANPKQPEAAKTMISLVMASGGAPGDTPRLWFDRAIAAELEYHPAYEALRYAYTPRWGGSYELMFAFAKACVETKRFDTEVPQECIPICWSISREMPDTRSFLRTPEISKTVVGVSQALAREPSLAADRPRFVSLLACYAWLCGEFPLAQQTLKSIPQLQENAMTHLRDLDYSEAEFRSEIAICASPALPFYIAADKAYVRNDLPAAQAKLEEAMHTTPAEGKALLASKQELIALEQKLTSRDWVKLTTKPGLANWVIERGEWTAEEDGTLVNIGAGETGFIMHRARLGTEVEIRADYKIQNLRKDHKSGLGLAINVHRAPGRQWYACELIQMNNVGTAFLLQNLINMSKEHPEVKMAEGVNHLLVRLSGGRVSLECNGAKVLKNLRPEEDATFATDGRVGLGSFRFGTGVTTRINNIEVRRLAP